MILGAQLMTLNRHLALSRVGGDEELLREVTEIYLEECPTLVAEIERAIQAGDSAGLQKSAHTLKGSVGAVGGEMVAHCALQLETMGRQHDLTDAASAMQDLRAALETLHTELKTA